MRPQFVGTVGGLTLFGLFLVLSHFADLHWSTRWQIAIEVVGWGLLVGLAAWLTRRWLAPAALLAAGVLSIALDRVADALVQSRTDRDVALGTLLSPVIGLVGGALLVTGLALTASAIFRNWRGNAGKR